MNTSSFQFSDHRMHRSEPEEMKIFGDASKAGLLLMAGIILFIVVGTGAVLFMALRDLPR